MNNPKNVSDLADQSKNDLNFSTPVKGTDFEKEISILSLIDSFGSIGFQATNLYKAVEEIKKMKNSKIFLGCTSNIISSGIRDIIKYLIKNKNVNVFVTTAGGIEEDLIKTFKDTFLASFDLKGRELRENGFNRIGNLVIPNENYVQFEKWLISVLDELTEGYSVENPRILTPSAFIKILGSKINCESSVLYWASQNNIPVYCPAITDGSIGDILTFYKNRNLLKIDIVEDIYNMNKEAMFEKSTGAIVIGCGVIKHHILNANLFKNGLNYCVLINTAEEYNGSDAGANVEEAVSWGKIKKKNTAVKIFGDASIIFPLIVAATFYEFNKK